MSKRVGLRYIMGIMLGWKPGPPVATKFDGHTEADDIQNVVCMKYDGHSEAEDVYNFVGTKYDGHVESSITIS